MLTPPQGWKGVGEGLRRRWTREGKQTRLPSPVQETDVGKYPEVEVPNAASFGLSAWSRLPIKTTRHAESVLWLPKALLPETALDGLNKTNAGDWTRRIWYNWNGIWLMRWTLIRHATCVQRTANDNNSTRHHESKIALKLYMLQVLQHCWNLIRQKHSPSELVTWTFQISLGCRQKKLFLRGQTYNSLDWVMTHQRIRLLFLSESDAVSMKSQICENGKEWLHVWSWMLW